MSLSSDTFHKNKLLIFLIELMMVVELIMHLMVIALLHNCNKFLNFKINYAKHLRAGRIIPSA